MSHQQVRPEKQNLIGSSQDLSEAAWHRQHAQEDFKLRSQMLEQMLEALREENRILSERVRHLEAELLRK